MTTIFQLTSVAKVCQIFTHKSSKIVHLSHFLIFFSSLMQNIQDHSDVIFFINLGVKIRQLRVSNGLSDRQFARLIQIRTAYLSGIERGQKNISFVLMMRIAKTLGIKPENLVADL